MRCDRGTRRTAWGILLLIESYTHDYFAKGALKRMARELNDMYTKRDCSTRNELKLKLNYNTTYELQEL